MNKKIENSDHKGITIIALIITIIIMLILVGVTINVAINGGLFETAKQAKINTKEAIDVEQALADGRVKIEGIWYKSIEDYLNNKPYLELPEGIKVGDYINYNPDIGTYKVESGKYGSGITSGEVQSFITENEDTSLKWRILSIDEQTGKIELVSETVAQTLKLYGPNGYNHGVDILNDLCKTLYSKTVNKKKVAIGRSIGVEDINKKTTYDYTTNSVYGDEIKYSNYEQNSRKYPNIYLKEDGVYVGGKKQTGGMSESTGLNDGVVNAEGITEYKAVIDYTNDYGENSKDISVTNTHYLYYPEKLLRKDLGMNTAPEGLIDLGISYWLASRCVARSGTSGPMYFTLREMHSEGYVYNEFLFNSEGAGGYKELAVRPVVSLEFYVSLEKDSKSSTDKITYWNVKF